MDGVTILTEASVRGTDLFTVCVGWIGYAVLAVYFFVEILSLWKIKSGMWGKLLSVTLGIIIAFIFSVAISSFVYPNHVEYQTIYTEYTVTIDDSVGFNEFYKHYEIISQDGNIYTVREAGE